MMSNLIDNNVFHSYTPRWVLREMATVLFNFTDISHGIMLHCNIVISRPLNSPVAISKP